MYLLKDNLSVVWPPSGLSLGWSGIYFFGLKLQELRDVSRWQEGVLPAERVPRRHRSFAQAVQAAGQEGQELRRTAALSLAQLSTVST